MNKLQAVDILVDLGIKRDVATLLVSRAGTATLSAKAYLHVVKQLITIDAPAKEKARRRSLLDEADKALIVETDPNAVFDVSKVFESDTIGEGEELAEEKEA